MLEYKILEYSDRADLAPILRAKNSYLSEYSFTNSYLFRKPHDYHIAKCGGCTFLKGISYDGFSYVMPVCPLEIIPLDSIVEISKTVDFIFPIQENWLNFFPENMFEYSSSDGDSDYIYLTERLALLPGRKLSKKRNLFKQYGELYSADDHTLTLGHYEDAKKVLDIWLSELQEEGASADYNECLEALQKMDELNLSGMICYADGKPSGFVLGEELNDETFVLHFAKGAREYKGIYQHMYKSFALSILDKYKFMNFEQDLGKESLHQAKSTYYPDNMMTKFRAKFKK